MPQVVRCQLILNPAATPKEQIMNTWHCVTVGATTTLAASTAFSLALQTFMNTIDIKLSSEMNGLTPLFRAFDLSDPKPRQPINEDTYSAMACGTGRAPREIACCLSYKGTYLSGVSPKRKRGRLYLGPLESAAINSSTGLIAASVQSQWQSAANALLTTSDASTEFRWVVYSPTSDPTGEGNDPDCWDAVTSGWIDDNPDVQRRRSVPGGSRELFS